MFPKDADWMAKGVDPDQEHSDDGAAQQNR